MSEYEERRLEIDRALVCCAKLQDELQYIAETMPADKNKYMNIVLEIDAEAGLLRAFRKADNRFREKLKQ